MTLLVDNFTSDTGQITSFIPTIWTAGGGSESITGGQLVSVATASGGTIHGILTQENAWTVATPDILVTMNMGTPTWVRPLPSGQAHFGVGIVKDGNNCVFFELGPDGSSTNLTLFVFGIIGGTAFTFASGTLANINLPDAVGFGLVNNIVTAYLSFGGVWQAVSTIGTGGNVDVSAHYDFTAPGALTGWMPGTIWGSIFVPSTSTIAIDQIQYLTPFASPVVGATVPNVVGELESAAMSDIIAVSCDVGIVTTLPSSMTPTTVLSQNPVGGTMVPFGTPVDLVIAVAGTPTIVPDLTNTSIAITALELLAAANLVLGTVTYVSSVLIIPGNVITQTPAPGTSVIEGSAVNVVVSTGRAGVIVPDLIGLTEAEAIAAIVSVGLLVNVISTAPSATMPSGEVSAQNPVGGTSVASGSFVGFIVSTGAPVVGEVFDFEATVISQYANSPTILQLVENMNAYIDQTANFAAFFAFVWNVDTAQGFGLDIWGKIVNVSRLLQIPTTALYVGFQNSSGPPAWDEQPFNADGTFFTGQNATQSYLLDDDSYRRLILTKAFSNIVNTTAPAINQILQRLFPGRGNPYVANSGVMAIIYTFDFDLTPIELAILQQSTAVPSPVGVSVSISVP